SSHQGPRTIPKKLPLARLSLLIKVRPLGLRDRRSGLGPFLAPQLGQVWFATIAIRGRRWSTAAPRAVGLRNVSGCRSRLRSRPAIRSTGGRCQDAKAGSPHGRFLMRDARSRPLLPRRRLLRVVPACALALAGWGCQQPPCFCYSGYGLPPCAPAP